MAAPTDTFIDPAAGATNGNDHGGNAFVDGAFANATLTLTKIGAFTAATCQAGDKIYLDDNGSGEVTPGLYTVNARVDNDNVTLTADIRSGINDPTDVRCDQHTGAVGLPWATTQHALDFKTRDAVNGDRFNVRDTADDVLAAALDLTAYGTPTEAAPLTLQGYSTAAGDEGIGGLSGGGAVSIITSATLDFIRFVDMHLHDTGANKIIDLDNNIEIIRCEFDNTSTDAIDVDNASLVLQTYVHNAGGEGIHVAASSVVRFCTVENGADDVTTAIAIGNNGEVSNNIVSIDGASDGISSTGTNTIIEGNDIYSSAGTGKGVTINGLSSSLMNNIVEGFSGVGGIGYDVNVDLILYGHNKAYNNTTNFDLLAGTFQAVDLGNNDVLLASPFTNPGAGNFEVDTTVQAAGWPEDFPGIATDTFIDAGAAQREEAGGGTIGWW